MDIPLHKIDGQKYTTKKLMVKTGRSKTFINRRIKAGAKTLADFIPEKRSCVKKNKSPPLSGNWATAMVNDEMIKLALRVI